MNIIFIVAMIFANGKTCKIEKNSTYTPCLANTSIKITIQVQFCEYSQNY